MLEVDSTGLFIKAGTRLDFETKASYSVTVAVDDPTLGATPDATATYTLVITDVIDEPPSQPSVVISEVAPWSSGNSPVGADWFELTNSGGSTVDIIGWKIDDNSESFAAAVPLSGIPSIKPGESVIFIETSDLAGARTAFLNTWFGSNPPAGLQIGSYSGGSVGLSTGGDAVNVYSSTGVLQAKVFFGVSPAGPSFPTFDNAVGLNNAAVSQLSAGGVHGAFVAANDANEIGSPGTIGNMVMVNDPPTVTVPFHLQAEATGPSGAVVDFTATATDVIDGPLPVTCTPGPGATFPLGETTVSCSATNLRGKSATATFAVTVRDRTAPDIISVTPSVTHLPDTDQIVPITIVVGVTDRVDPAPVCRISRVTGQGSDIDHDTVIDWAITGDLTLNITANARKHRDRVYTVTVTCTDMSGNPSKEKAAIVVSHAR